MPPKAPQARTRSGAEANSTRCGASASRRYLARCLSRQRRRACQEAPRQRKVAAILDTAAQPRARTPQAQGIPDLPGRRDGDLASRRRTGALKALGLPSKTQQGLSADSAGCRRTTGFARNDLPRNQAVRLDLGAGSGEAMPFDRPPFASGLSAARSSILSSSRPANLKDTTQVDELARREGARPSTAHVGDYPSAPNGVAIAPRDRAPPHGSLLGSERRTHRDGGRVRLGPVSTRHLRAESIAEFAPDLVHAPRPLL
jgi:hypothetical protein